jgi:hypothetical protein
MSHTDIDTAVGILLPELVRAEGGQSLTPLMKQHMKSSSSRGAQDILFSSNPSRSISDGSSKRLIYVEGPTLGKDPHHLGSITAFARKQGWSEPTVEDALRLFVTLTKERFNPGAMTKIIVMHKPVNEHVLGITFENGGILLSAHKAKPREGFLCRKIGFVFRST